MIQLYMQCILEHVYIYSEGNKLFRNCNNKNMIQLNEITQIRKNIQNFKTN